MGNKKINVLGIVFLGLAVVALVLAIVGMVTPLVSGTVGKETLSFELSHEMWDHAEGSLATAHTLALLGDIIALVGSVAVIAYFVLKMFVGKNIKLIGIIGAIAALVGGILAFVGAGIAAGWLNTMGGTITNMKVYDPATGAILALIGGIVAGIVGIVGSNKKFD